jgi:cytochrome c oxidase subunit 2
MAFAVRVLDKPAFATWLRAQTSAADAPKQPHEQAGHNAFLEHGCGACHTVRGTTARGVIGPDLTHVGSRATIGAGRFARSPRTFERWLAHPDAVKPGVLMPSFAMLPAPTLRDLAHYLESLR